MANVHIFLSTGVSLLSDGGKDGITYLFGSAIDQKILWDPETWADGGKVLLYKSSGELSLLVHPIMQCGFLAYFEPKRCP